MTKNFNYSFTFLFKGGGVVTSIINVYTDVRLKLGILLMPSSIWMGIVWRLYIFQFYLTVNYLGIPTFGGLNYTTVEVSGIDGIPLTG